MKPSFAQGTFQYTEEREILENAGTEITRREKFSERLRSLCAILDGKKKDRFFKYSGALACETKLSSFHKNLACYMC